ncbi:Na+/H+ antiporter subunit E [Wolbachia endosymbiont of Howardula sp.]|uniref:Na+/H+ antiporter subunit E n=1 Tax=Wolbachia endosymbiont of Howardula sp. TaxID=2916816 RepID=UPI00217D275C|nr:Na+/H+ antiporter subunit E [Wolbachia endosymbiont of Howardula sp.]UWI83344.1 Na+/H+ antiporter subunit E [Wolbachia endosymbiont of Howardula sp.]
MYNLNFKYIVELFFLFSSLLTIWIILSGRLEIVCIICGVLSSLIALYIFKKITRDNYLLHKILLNTYRFSIVRLIHYILWLIYQMFISSIYVAKQVLQPKFNAHMPIIILFAASHNHTESSIALFAHSVTLTPGTLTLDVVYHNEIYLLRICIMNHSLECGISAIEMRVLKIILS